MASEGVSSSLESPVVVDGIVSDEKLSELLRLQTEYSNLDYKSRVDPAVTRDLVELVKDIGAMQVLGGYLLLGVNDDGTLSGAMDDVDPRHFDEASLTSKVARYLPSPLKLATRVTQRDGHQVTLICVSPSPLGCAFFKAHGTYSNERQEEVAVFRAGDVFWRDGTKSTRMTQEGLEHVIARRVAREKQMWMEEQREIRRQERIELEAGVETRKLVEGSLGAVDLSLAPSEISQAALEFVRRGDEVALRHLTLDARDRARSAITAGDLNGLAELLDKLACLAATFLVYGVQERFLEVVRVLVDVYGDAFGADDPSQFGYATSIHPNEPAPRVWLAIVERVMALGGLAVRQDNWEAVKTLAVQLPDVLIRGEYEVTWLRHAVTMASRAGHFEIEDDEGRPKSLSLIALARAVAARLRCLRPDLADAESDELLTSIAQFDVLSNVVAIGNAESISGRVFYTNFARLYQSRIQPIVERLLGDKPMRSTLFPGDDAQLAEALNVIGERATSEGWRFDGFEGWGHTPVGEFIQVNLPQASS